MFIFLYCICIEFLYVYFRVLLCLSVSVKWLAVKTASEMTYIVSGGALNSTHSLTLNISAENYTNMWYKLKANGILFMHTDVISRHLKCLILVCALN